jgi:Fur family ferric uptake transcriptional regulator
VTAEAVAADVRGDVGSISRQAVYDALAALVGANLVRRIQPAGSPARFEVRVRDNHHHVICRSCGVMSDVDCAVGAAPCLDPAGSDYVVDEAEVTFWGLCPACSDEQKARQ